MVDLPIEQINLYQRTITEEVFNAFGIVRNPLIRKWMRGVFSRPTRRFAELAAAYEAGILSDGFRAATEALLPRFLQRWSVRGADCIPDSGPLLIVSNHPGAYDGVLISANIPRDDLKIVLSGVPFTQALTQARKSFLYATSDPYERMGVIRKMIRHLHQGGSLLIFPSGTLDPDPSFMSGAEQALSRWSASLEIVLRRVPQARVLISMVSGMLSEKVYHHPLARLQNSRFGRQKLAEFIQVMQQLVTMKDFALSGNLSFAPPFTAKDLNHWFPESELMTALIEHAKQQLQQHIQDFKLAVL